MDATFQDQPRAKLVVTEEELASIRTDREHHPDPRVRRRLTILWLRILGETNERIATLVDLSRRQVQRILNILTTQGLKAVMTFHEKGRPSQLDGFRERIRQELTHRPLRTIDLVREKIRLMTNVDLGKSRVREILHALGFHWRKSAAVPLPPKKTIAEHIATQAEFLRIQLEPRLNEALEDQRVVYFVDAAHFVLASQLGHLWCPHRFYVRAGSGRQRFNVLGALDPISLELIEVHNTQSVNSDTLDELLRKIHAKQSGKKVTLVLDNAKYQKNARVHALAEELNIELLYLPSYSPNLNLIERLWKLIRAEALPSRHHTNFVDFQDVILDCICRLGTTLRSKLARLLTLRFQTFEGYPLLPV